MPLYRVAIWKGLGPLPAGNADWSNVYTVSAAGADDAEAVAAHLIAAEQHVFSTDVYFRLAQITPKIPHSENGRTLFSTASGNRTPGTAPLPLWNTALVEFIDLDHSRPEKKWLRCPIYSEDHVGGTLQAGILADMNVYAAAVMTGIVSGYACGPHGETFASYQVFGSVAMRQTDWHRRSRKGFHRGYVPNV